MILEIDCGNTLIKWRVVSSEIAGVVREGATQAEEGLMTQLFQLAESKSIDLIRLVSVRTEYETDRLVNALQLKYSLPVRIAKSTGELAGVKNGYLEPELLGADRWLAIVAAYRHIASACLVMDVGTAVTADYVSADGIHLGGFIGPGIKLMREQLGARTQRIKLDSHADSAGDEPGRQTSEAVERGTKMMLQGFAAMQIQMAQGLWGKEFSVILTGGDAALLELKKSEGVILPDLVFSGLALACPN